MTRFLTLIVFGLALTACGQDSGGDAAPAGDAEPQAAESATGESDTLSLDSEQQKRSYALGMDIGKSLSDMPAELELDYLTAGLRDRLQDGETQLTEQESRETLQAFMQELQAAQQQEKAAEAEENQAAGEAFLADNKGKDGVTVTDSGLQYEVIEAGDGPSPGPEDSVRVHYEGTLIDGTVFDSSRERGEPVTFPVNAVIPGWTEALQMMSEGARYRLFIPADLAYGQQGAGANIGPNEALIFDVELLEVQPAESDE